VYNNLGDDMKSYKKIIELYFKSMRGFNEFESIPRDFGTGDLLYSSEIHTLQAIGNNANVNLTELAEKLDISKSGTSKFVKKLLEKNLITKSKQLNNKKEVVFNLTKMGLIAYIRHEEFDKEAFNSMYNILFRLDENQIDFLESFLDELVLEVERLNNKQ
jgi:DNA-binding MarR family transcriptional regulator